MSTATLSDVEHEIGLSGRLIVRVRSTDVRFRGVDGRSVGIRGQGGAALQDVEVETGDGQLTVTVRSGRAPDLEIDVPVGAAIAVEGTSSDIDARGLHGDQRYRTASGDVRLDAVRGSITAEAVSGDVDIVASGPASILARTVSGELSIQAGTLDALRVTTTSGDVRVAGRFAGPGPFGIETVSGDVILASADGLRVLATTITGDVRSDEPARQDGPRGRRSLVVGDGGATMTFRSMSGDLRLVRAIHRSPTDAAGSTSSRQPAADPTDEARLDILRAVERGDIDIDEADRRLEALERSTKHLEADRV